jgi:hypothetical protein
MFIVDEGGKAKGECRIDFEIIQVLVDGLAELDWPVIAELYIVKQLYVITK